MSHVRDPFLGEDLASAGAPSFSWTVLHYAAHAGQIEALPCAVGLLHSAMCESPGSMSGTHGNLVRKAVSWPHTTSENPKAPLVRHGLCPKSLWELAV